MVKNRIINSSPYRLVFQKTVKQHNNITFSAIGIGGFGVFVKNLIKGLRSVLLSRQN